jgi:HK97 family phage major capsid protein
MASNIITLRQRAKDKEAKLRALLDKASLENRDLNESEAAQYDDELKALGSVDKSIEREQSLLERERTTAPIDDLNQRAAEDAGTAGQKGAFKSLGEQLQAVAMFRKHNGRNADPRLFAGPAGASEAVPSDGGFQVQKDLSSEMLTRTYSTGEISSRCRKIPISARSNGLKINAIDEDSRQDGSRFGGVQGFWANEAALFTASKTKTRQIELQLQKLIGLYYTTDELLEDAAALEAVVMEAFAEEMVFKVEDSIIAGNGAGQPLGILNSGALVTQAKDAADASATVSTNDVLAMWSRLWAPSRKNAVWLIDQTVEPKLSQLTLGSPSLGQILLYAPPGQNGNSYGTLYGRPVIAHEHATQLGTPGDIVLADLSQYMLIDKGGVRQDYSIHVNFLTDEGTFRFVYRVDGQTWWKKPLTPKNGGPTQSPFVSLATRP